MVDENQSETGSEGNVSHSEPNSDAQQVKELRRSLRLTRAMAVGLVVLLGLVWYQYERELRPWRKLRQHAAWYYPFIPITDHPIDFQVDYYGLKYTGNTLDDYELLYTGGSEKPDAFFMRDVLARVAKPTEGVFVDVGASKGVHTLFMSPHAGRVVAVEPSPSAVKHLRELVDLNQLSNIEILPVGFGEKDDELPFFAPKVGHLSGSFDPKFSKQNVPIGKLKIRIGDEALNELKLPNVDLVKIDVESFEKQVLKGLVKTLAEQRPVVVMELLPEGRGKRSIDTYDELRSLFPEDYEFLQFDDYEVYTGRYSLAPLDFDAHVFRKIPELELVPQNIVAYPVEKKELIPLANPP